MKLIEKIIPASNVTNSATVIFFHGSGNNMKSEFIENH